MTFVDNRNNNSNNSGKSRSTRRLWGHRNRNKNKNRNNAESKCGGGNIAIIAAIVAGILFACANIAISASIAGTRTGTGTPTRTDIGHTESDASLLSLIESLINETSKKTITLTIEILNLPVDGTERLEIDHYYKGGNGNTSTGNASVTTTSSNDGTSHLLLLKTILHRRNESLFPPPRNHPFAGARDVNGNWGYVADPKFLRKVMLHRFRQETSNPDASYDDMIKHDYLPLNDEKENKQVCETPPFEGHEKKGFDVLARKIVIGGNNPLPLEGSDDAREPPKGWDSIKDKNNHHQNKTQQPYRNTPNPPRLLCGLYTYRNRHWLVKEAAETWGWRCDGWVAFSDVTDPSIGAVDLPHYGEESYNNMWQKVRSIWMYIYTNYANEYDYFHVAGDDMMMVVENMRNYLWSIDDENGTKPLYIGESIKLGGMWLCGGGPGYTLNKVVLEWLANGPFSTTEARRKSNEDTQMGHTLRKYVKCYLTHDALGQKRYVGTDAQYMATFDGKGGNKFMRQKTKEHQKLVGKNLTGGDLVSSQAVSWHWLRARCSMKRYHAIMYRACPRGTVLANALEEIDQQTKRNKIIK